MKYYNVIIQVDSAAPRQMPPLRSSERPWRAVGYFRTFFCTEHSKEKAKKLVQDYFLQNEDNAISCKFRFERVAWMRGLTKREQIAQGITPDLTEEMFNKRDQIGIWYYGEKDHYVSEEDYAASEVEEYYQNEKGQ